jgi:hypothetical protein
MSYIPEQKLSRLYISLEFALRLQAGPRQK